MDRHTMKMLLAASAVVAALALAGPAAGQYAVRNGVVNGTYSYGYYPSLGYSFPTYINGYYAGPGTGSPGFSYSSAYGTGVAPGPSGVAGPSYINSTAPLGRIAVATVGGTYIPPYSYTVVGHPYYARHYAGYGQDDFPFYGRIYGRAYDSWSWTYLSGGHYNALAGYYYPPVL